MKRYPFSANKHAHDIELVKNRAFNLAYDARDNGELEKYDHYMSIHDEANNVLCAILDGMQGWSGVTMLDGKTLAKAKEFVLLASELRDATMMNRR